eukprot:7794254-Pyramimonas_sp.AAC.1
MSSYIILHRHTAYYILVPHTIASYISRITIPHTTESKSIQHHDTIILRIIFMRHTMPYGTTP